MEIPFYKYQGTGNDFIMIDDRDGEYGSLTLLNSPKTLAGLCHRRMGIGADGVILLQQSAEYDFKMKYYNSDGHESSMCGNGGRCIAKFAYSLGMVGDSCRFEAIDGEHLARIEGDIVRLKMKDVKDIHTTEIYSVLDTGSPHVVTTIAEGIDALDVDHAGAQIRNSPDFISEGINVNFVSLIAPHHLKVRTYERGVEAETYSCGTGVTASSIALAAASPEPQTYTIDTLGGQLEVSFIKKSEDQATDVWLSGPAVEVYRGTTAE